MLTPGEHAASFARRHIGPSVDERAEMLQMVGAPSIGALMDEAIPASIRLRTPLDLPAAQTEHEYLQRLTAIARQNKTFRS